MKKKIKSLRVLLSISHKEIPLVDFEKIFGKSEYSYSVGDPHQISGQELRYRKSTFWSIIEESDDLLDINLLLSCLFVKAEPFKDNFLSLKDTVTPELLIWHIRDDNDFNGWFGFCLTNEQISFLHSINASMDISA